MSHSQTDLKVRVHRNLLRIVLVQLSILGILALVVKYDLEVRTPWILDATITRVLGWIMALYGLFWIVWWFFWSAIEGGEGKMEMYRVRWAPVTTNFVRDGPFEWLRYPLAFGYLEFLWGLGFLVQSTTTVLYVVPAMAIVAIAYLRLVVDRRKVKQHGEAYRRYRKATPLLIPRVPDSAVIMNLFKRRKRR